MTITALRGDFKAESTAQPGEEDEGMARRPDGFWLLRRFMMVRPVPRRRRSAASEASDHSGLGAALQCAGPRWPS